MMMIINQPHNGDSVGWPTVGPGPRPPAPGPRPRLKTLYSSQPRGT